MNGFLSRREHEGKRIPIQRMDRVWREIVFIYFEFLDFLTRSYQHLSIKSRLTSKCWISCIFRIDESLHKKTFVWMNCERMKKDSFNKSRSQQFKVNLLCLLETFVLLLSYSDFNMRLVQKKKSWKKNFSIRIEVELKIWISKWKVDCCCFSLLFRMSHYMRRNNMKSKKKTKVEKRLKIRFHFFKL